MKRITSFLAAIILTLALVCPSLAAPLYSTIQVRRDTAANFATTNPVLLQGEPAFEYDTQRLKFGDGLTPWASLPYQPAGALSLYGTSTSTLTIAGSGSVTLTTQTGLQFGAGAYIIVSSTATPSNYMQGVVTAYNTTTGVLVFTSVVSHGSGTASTWRIGISGVTGPTGGGGSLPAGAYYATFAAACDTGFLPADGAALSRSTYSDLFAAICPGGGTSCPWGSGNGSTTFNAPNMLGRIVVAAGQGLTAEGGGTGTNRVVAATGGAEAHTQTSGEMPTHTHATTVTINDPGHLHTFITYGSSGSTGFPNGLAGSASTNPYDTTSSFTGITASAAVADAGSGSAMSMMNPYAVLTVCVKH